MIKYVFKILKRIVISSFLLYAYNLIVQPVGLIIPINIFTISIITLLGFPSMFALIFMMIYIY